MQFEITPNSGVFVNEKIAAILLLNWRSYFTIDQLTHLTVQVEEDESDEQLEEEQRAEDPGVGGGEAMVLSDGPAAAAKRDEENEEAEEDEEHGDGEETVVQKVQVLTIGQLSHYPGQYQDEAKDLNIFPC